MRSIRFAKAVAAASLLAQAACGPDETAGRPDAGVSLEVIDAGVDAQVTFMLGADGVTPELGIVSAGARVRFVNEDSVAHQPASDPHFLNHLCPELNAPAIDPGREVVVVAPNHPVRCTFHDRLRPSAQSFQGTLVVE